MAKEKLYKATVIWKENKKREISIIESAYTSKAKFINELRSNGFYVNPNHVKVSEVYNWLVDNAETRDEWKYVNSEKDINTINKIGMYEFLRNKRVK